MTDHLLKLAVHAFYADEFDVGRRSCERLLAMPLSPSQEELVRRNRTWYTRPLSSLMPARGTRLDVRPAFDGWSLFNPTIAPLNGGFLAIVRSSNYSIVEGRYEIPPADAGVIRTENILVRLSSTLMVIDARTIRCDYPANDFPVTGLEDCRLNCVYTPAGARQWRVSATIRNHAGFDGNARIGTADLDIDEAVLSNVTVYPEPIPGRHEKNWMPLYGTGRFLYSAWEDGDTAEVEDAGGSWSIRKCLPSPAIARGFRGGSQFVSIKSGWLGLVHEVAADTGGRIYEHRWIALEHGGALSGISEPFYFVEHRAIEFAAGLARQGDRLVATFGVRDAEAWVVEVNVDDVVKSLQHVDTPSEEE